MAYNIISDGTNSNIYQDGTLAYTFVNADTTLSISGHDITFDDGNQTVTIVDELISGVSSTQSRENSIYAQLCEIFNKDAYDAGGGATSFVIASGTVDLGTAGSTELTYTTGFDGTNHVATAIVIEADNDTDTFTVSANPYIDEVNLNGVNLSNIDRLWIGNGLANAYPIYGERIYRGVLDYGQTYLTDARADSLSSAAATDKYTVVINNEPSTTEFNVTVKIIGLKTS